LPALNEVIEYIMPSIITAVKVYVTVGEIMIISEQLYELDHETVSLT
jgi:hypothetical protein